MDASRLGALRLVYSQVEAADRAGVLVDHLARRSGETSGQAQFAYRLAASVIPWWRGDRKAALASLDQLGAQFPDDANLALVRINGHLLVGEITRAIALLDQAHADSTPLAGDFDRMRAQLGDRLRTGTRDQVLDCVMLLLKSQSREPDLGFLFGAPAQPASFGGRLLPVSGAVGTNQPFTIVATQPTIAAGGTVVANFAPSAQPLPTGPVSTVSLDELLTFAKSRGLLDALERAAGAQWDKHRGSSRLGAIVTLAHFARGDMPAAALAAGRFGALVATRPEHAGEVEALWIVARCLDHAETASLGRNLARDVLPAARARGLRPEAIDLTIRIIKSAVTADQKDDALAELGRLQEALAPPRPPAAP
jgi:hypothetical protein